MNAEAAAAGARALIDESTRHMQAGMDAMAAGDGRRAVVDFENAVRLRHRLPWREDGYSAWLLAAAWINHGEAMVGGGGPERLAAAVRSMDGCIAAMARVPLADNPAFPERLMLAWIHRAGWQGELGRTDPALDDFQRAGDLLDQWGRAETPTRRVLHAMLGVNRARLLLQAGRIHEAWHSVAAVTRGQQPVDAPAAMIKACGLQCRILAAMLEAKLALPDGEDWIALARDSAERTLEWVRASGYRDAWVAEVVRYGARVYRCCQPWFLAEFLHEWVVEGPLAGDAALREALRCELLLAQDDARQRVLDRAADNAYVEGQIRLVQGLQHVMNSLANDPGHG